MGSSSEDIIKAILHYQERLERYNLKKSEDKMLYVLRKLSKLPIKTSHLETTGVGRTVNALKKLNGKVADSAKDLVMTWKEMVLEEEEKAAQENAIETEEDADSVYSSDNEQSLRIEEGKENVNNESDEESDHSDESERNTKQPSQSRLDKSKHNDSTDEESRRRSKKRPRSSDSSSDDASKHKPKKSKRDHHKDKVERKHDRHSSSGKTKHKSPDKDKTDRDRSGKSSHSSKHKSSESQADRKERKDKSDADGHSKHRDKSKKPKEDRKQSTSKNETEAKKEKSKVKIINGIDSESGASFAEALGMCGPTSSHSNKKKPSSDRKPHKSEPSKSSNSKHDDSKSKAPPKPIPDLLNDVPNEPLNICLSSLLPEITPHYKPTPLNLDLQAKRVLNEDEALSRVMSNKNQRTKVYSGNKTVGKVESLFQICVRILQDNIEALEYTGGVPYHILKPILDRATPDQLFNLEHHNPYLIEETDELWQLLCQKDFRNKKREELESWREMYMRCLDEREAKLNLITASIKQSQDKSEPVRTTKLAYVDSSFVKPPRNIARKQAKNGTLHTDRKMTPTQKLSALSRSDTEKIALPNPGNRAVERSSNSSAATKPKKAPLMAKTLSFFKNRFKR
ncbi:unnamed protein product [Phyllotreta striolata]|uniref:TFIIS N-terminal domain-containing protein n=1 Tax=Phyllotreta striolata TaxID=444603 RepID=A0A9N9XTZ5_PHYSR|nr:unnamed protein product [Phyllotreta striolata]